MAKHIFILFFLITGISTSFSQVDSVYTGVPKNRDPKQEKKQRKFPIKKENLTYGGFIMPGYYQSRYGNVFYISANPNVGYRITEDLTVALQLTYSYTSVKSSYAKYSQTIYGPGALARYRIFNNAFLMAQYSQLSQPNYFAGTDKRIWVQYLYAGGGYYQSFSDNAGIMYSIMYNLTPSSNSIYSNPLIQIGFVVGF